LEEASLTRTIRHTLTAGLFTSAVLFMGCTPGASIPGLPGGIMSAMPSMSPTPKPVTKDDCTAASPQSSPDTGAAGLGAYANQLLPQGWNNAYKSEAQVTEAIAKWDVNETGSESDKSRWACFQKFYQGATTVYMSKKAAPAAAASAAPAASASPAAN
jgi:hypothetical protein